MSESTTTDPSTGESPAHDQGEPDGQKWLSGIVSLIGFWLAASPFVYETAQSILWNNLLVGGAIFLLAGYNYYRIVTDHPTSTGVMSLVALLALWTAISHFAIGGEVAMSGLEVADRGLTWSNTVLGLVAAALSAYVASTAGREVPRGTATETR
ncbi:SPW repeat protein [Natrinema salaciae]|uniref:SPW repeat-containing protein n=1 Tax=Natrinema salaciae TaxID=1186196 RepID=A0A1H9GW32_9EURY|nr:SPW repeat protein [Natrinema salaciae]SEQ54336.1 SPW repeat-containing protein [Natrinema salaciae]